MKIQTVISNFIEYSAEIIVEYYHTLYIQANMKLSSINMSRAESQNLISFFFFFLFDDFINVISICIYFKTNHYHVIFANFLAIS